MRAAGTITRAAPPARHRRRRSAAARFAAGPVLLGLLVTGCARGGGDFTVTIDATAAGCELSRTRIPAGRTNFVLRNGTERPVSVAITKPVGAARADVPSTPPGESTAQTGGLVGGDYTVACVQEGGATVTTPLLVTGDRTEEPPVGQTVAVTLGDDRIDGLSTFSAPGGARVGFEVTNGAAMPRGLRIVDPGGAVVGELGPLPPGGVASLAVTLPRNGTYVVTSPAEGRPDAEVSTTIVVGR